MPTPEELAAARLRAIEERDQGYVGSAPAARLEAIEAREGGTSRATPDTVQRGQVDVLTIGPPGTAAQPPSVMSRMQEAMAGASRELPSTRTAIEVIPEATQRQLVKGAPRLAAGTAISMAGERAGTQLGARFGGIPGGIIGSALGSLAARMTNIQLELEEPGRLGDALALAPAVVSAVLQGFKYFLLPRTAAGRQVQRSQQIAAAKAAAEAEKARLRGLSTEVTDVAGEAALQQQQLASQGAGLRTAARQGLQGRVEATEELGERLTTGTQAGLQRRGEELTGLQERLQAAGQQRLGQVTGPQLDGLVRTMANTGKDTSEAAIKLAYQQVEQYTGTRLPRRRLDTALAEIAGEVRRGLREALSIIPKVPKGTPPQSIANTMTFGQVRTVQRQVGQNIRILERQVARGSDVDAPGRLRALKRVYAATFEILDDAVEQARLPANAKIALQEANTLNRIAATFDRLDTLREVHGTRNVGGNIVFDAQNLRQAIRDDGFLVRQLTNLGIYDGLDAMLGRMAVAQRGKLPPPGKVKVPPLHLMDPPTFESIPLAQRQAARESVMQRTGRQGAVQRAQGAIKAGQQTVDEQLTQQLAAIDRALPERAPGLPLARVAAGVPSALLLGQATGHPTAGLSVAGGIALLEGLSYHMLTPQGQRLMERALSGDPTLTLQRLRLLAAGLRPVATGESPATGGATAR